MHRDNVRRWWAPCAVAAVSIFALDSNERSTLADVLLRAILPRTALAGSNEAERTRKDVERAREEASRQHEQERERINRQQEAARETSKSSERTPSDVSGKADKESLARKDNRSSDDARHQKSGDDRVPDTLEGVLKRMFAPPAAPQPAPAAPTAKARASTPTSQSSFTLSSQQRPELLIAKLSKADVDRAVALGFKPNGTVGVAGADLGVTRFLAPDGMPADEARVVLQRALPNQGIEFNQKYRIYRTATGTVADVEQLARRNASPMATPCGTDRCFGTSLINWHPQLERCATAAKIGIIDTGYDQAHPAFRSRKIEVRKPTQTGQVRAPDWHGTGVIALLAGDPRSSTPGLVPDAHFYVADIFYADTDGQPASDTASLLQALDWLEKSRVDIVSMSLAGPPDELLKTALAGLAKKGIVFVAAAGNEGPAAPPAYPAAYDSVVAVTAVGKDLKSYRHANRGSHIDIAAPGVDIWTAAPGGKGGYHSGTSFAVPYVTAVLASMYRSLPAKTKASFLEHVAIMDLGPSGRDPIYGRGLIMAPAECRATSSASVAASSGSPVVAQGAMAIRNPPQR